MREKRAVIMRNAVRYLISLLLVSVACSPGSAQYFQGNSGHNYHPYWGGDVSAYQQGSHGWYQPDGQHYPSGHPTANLQYDYRDAEMILRDQVARTQNQYQADPSTPSNRHANEDYYGHRLHGEGQIGRVMAEARQIAQLIPKRNGKAFIVFDKRNFQFYLYDRDGKLLRIGPVAVGKGRTNVGAFETPVGVFPIKSKIPVDDWIRPDWYFVEEGEPIPSRWEDRKVPGFFRYKLVFEGTRYIHYAEATGGRLTHGCLGLDWDDAEAVFHTLDVGSYCIIIDGSFLARLARGEFPIQAPPATARKPSDDKQAVAVKADPGQTNMEAESRSGAAQERVFRSLW
ncbi:MAG: L,D-transpeptidase [Deltaproteobacteria bacterium]|nr:L,D-transpeptidase [Deltaproteobacteria bacterium]